MVLDEWLLIKDLLPESLENLVIKTVLTEGRKICLLRKNEKIFAFAATCPHAGASLEDGWINAKGEIVCCLHKYRFDPASGRNTSGEGYRLRTFPAEIKGGMIFVKINAKDK